MKNTGFLRGRAPVFATYHLFLKFLQINNAIPYSLAVQKKFTFRLKFFSTSHLRSKDFELPPYLQNLTYENKSDLDAHLKSNTSRWLLLLSIILQNMEFRSNFGFGTFFLYTLYCG